MVHEKDVSAERVLPIICWQQSVHVAFEAFGAEDEVFTPDQAKEVAVKVNLLQCAPRMFIEMEEGKRKRDEALKAAVHAAHQHGLTPAYRERVGNRCVGWCWRTIRGRFGRR